MALDVAAMDIRHALDAKKYELGYLKKKIINYTHVLSFI